MSEDKFSEYEKLFDNFFARIRRDFLKTLSILVFIIILLSALGFLYKSGEHISDRMFKMENIPTTATTVDTINNQGNIANNINGDVSQTVNVDTRKQDLIYEMTQANTLNKDGLYESVFEVEMTNTPGFAVDITDIGIDSRLKCKDGNNYSPIYSVTTETTKQGHHFRLICTSTVPVLDNEKLFITGTK